MPGTGPFGWLYPGEYFQVLGGGPQVVERAARLELDLLGLAGLDRDARLPLDVLSGAPLILFLNWLAAGGGAPVWWREIPTPAYVNLAPRTPAEHLRDRAPKRRRRRARPQVAMAVVEGHLVVEPPRLAEALRRLYRRRLGLPAPPPPPALPMVEAAVDLRESDEEFLVLAGHL